MMTRLLLVLVAALQPSAEPAPRPLIAKPIRSPDLPHVSAAFELPDGRVLVSDARNTRVVLLDPATGTLTPVGAAGGGPDRYARPGGLYPGPNGSTLLVDRGQTRVFTVGRDGALRGSRSIARKGVTVSSDADEDLQRLDASGIVYFADRSGSRPGLTPSQGRSEATLVRFDAGTQQAETISTLLGAERVVTGGGDGVVFSREIIGTPADGWGVAPDGRVAVVRASPYRVEWHGRDGRVVRGPVIDHPALPMTEDDKVRARQKYGRGGASVGMAGGPRTDTAGIEMLFAPSKAPFVPSEIRVAPDGRLWVGRTDTLTAPAAVHDIFDATARRVDRVALPEGSTVVGFGPVSVYVRQPNPDGSVRLLKFRGRQ